MWSTINTDAETLKTKTLKVKKNTQPKSIPLHLYGTLSGQANIPTKKKDPKKEIYM